jgi:DNA helicase IV
VRQLAVDLLQGSGTQIPHRDQSFWEQVSLNAACEALPPEGDRPQLVVVDEGQDFEEGDWMLVDQLAGPRGLWVFQDRRQAYWSDRGITDSLRKTLGADLNLPTSYRCPQSLSTFAEQYVDANLPGTRPAPDVLKLVPCAEVDVTERVRHELEVLLRQGAKPEQIVIVSLAGQTRSKLFGLEKLGSTKLVHADSPDAGKSAVVETFLRFKGLERPFVILTELGGKHVTHYETRMYIALTRATVQAIVVADTTALASDARLQSLLS